MVLMSLQSFRILMTMGVSQGKRRFTKVGAGLGSKMIIWRTSKARFALRKICIDVIGLSLNIRKNLLHVQENTSLWLILFCLLIFAGHGLTLMVWVISLQMQIFWRVLFRTRVDCQSVFRVNRCWCSGGSLFSESEQFWVMVACSSYVCYEPHHC